MFHLSPEVEGQSLGLLPHPLSPEVKEIIPGSQAAQAGMTNKVRSFDGQSVVNLVITEVGGGVITTVLKPLISPCYSFVDYQTSLSCNDIKVVHFRIQILTAASLLIVKLYGFPVLHYTQLRYRTQN